MTLFPKRKLAKLELKDRKQAERMAKLKADGPVAPNLGKWLLKHFPGLFKPVPSEEWEQPSPVHVPVAEHHPVSKDPEGHDFSACDMDWK